MKRHDKFSVILTLLPGLLLFLQVIPALADNLVTGNGKDQVLYLGQIEVKGTPMVIKVLQIIKQGLQEPYSTDPKMSNVVVCRLSNETGSHITQTLLCATNRDWSGVRAAEQTAIVSTFHQDPGGSHQDPGGTGCVTSTCYSEVFNAVNEALNSLPNGFLHSSVNGIQLRSLLKQIPMPAPAATTKAENSKP